MTELSAQARETLTDSGLSPARWIEAYGSEGKWTGDKCGCFDDRCIGHDHDECQCLSALIEFYFRDQNAIEDGKAVWTAPLLALLSGEPVDEEATARKAALWVGVYQGRSTVSYSLTELVGGKQGISIINTFDDTSWLVLDASVMTDEPTKQ